MRVLFSLFIFIGLLSLTPNTSLAADSLRALFARVSPSVCVLQTVGNEISDTADTGLTSAYGLGSGVLISADGKVLTAAHVVHHANAVAAEFANGEKIPATVLGTVPLADIALVQLDHMPEGITPAVLGDSDLMQVGDRVMIIGAPFGLSRAMSSGYLSGRHDLSEQSEGLVEVEVLQSDAAANTGNSGGPMFNMNGEVVGIISSILTRSGGFDGISFAISSNVTKHLLLEGKPRWTGLDTVMLHKYAAAFNVPQEAGLLVQRVAQGSMADRLGLKGGDKLIKIGTREVLIGGDVMLEVAGIKITPDASSLKSIRNKVQETGEGGTLFVKVLRAGKIKVLSINLQ
jgi:S1-C subfamily serine protease